MPYRTVLGVSCRRTARIYTKWQEAVESGSGRLGTVSVAGEYAVLGIG